MDLEIFARTVLFGSTLEEKLVRPDMDAVREELFSSELIQRPILQPPASPGRPSGLSLSQKEKARFPDLARIHERQVCGEILHFFANHELLALELMALVLLRFPEAPAPFRLGIARTMSEEQGHMSLYLKRMGELGVTFGDLPVSGYFWQALSQMQSPLQFVTLMSLTLEQANLDFSLFYRDAVAQTGDQETAAVLDQVYREEIGHVKHGLEWFNRWRAEDPRAPEDESDWDAYRRLLPSPMTPRRAKGSAFAIDARRQAGFSEIYIRELELYAGAKGRPPVLWLYNPFCDAEIARGKPGFSPKSTPERLERDLEHLPMFLASPQDTVLVTQRPSLHWLSSMKHAGFDVPEWAESSPSQIREPKFGGFEPWGWSPETFEIFRPLKERLVRTSGGNAEWCEALLSAEDYRSTDLGKLFSKTWSVDFLRRWITEHPKEADRLGCESSAGRAYTGWPEALEFLTHELRHERIVVAKAPWSTSGNGVRRVLKHEELNGALGGWIKNTIEAQGSIVLEPWLDKVHDLSIQIEVGTTHTRILEARKFLTGKQFEYRGTRLGPLRESFETDSLRLLQDALPAWKMLARDLGSELRGLGYQGPAGLDAMIFRHLSGELALKPLVELNPRWTMGRVALALEEKIQPGIAAAWIFVPLRELKSQGYENAEMFMESLIRRFPLQIVSTSAGPRIHSGVLATQDAARAQEVLSVLLIGEKALNWSL